MVEARDVIESHAIATVVGVDDETLAHIAAAMDAAIEDQLAAVASRDELAFVEADRAFHTVLVRAGCRSILLEVYGSLRDRQLRMNMGALGGRFPAAPSVWSPSTGSCSPGCAPGTPRRRWPCCGCTWPAPGRRCWALPGERLTRRTQPRSTRTTTVRLARSCQPRPSASRRNGGSTTAIIAVRSSARGTPTWVAMSVRATRMPSARCPGAVPSTDTVSAVITNQVPRTHQPNSGEPSASTPATSSTSR